MALPNLKKRIQQLRGEISDLVAIDKENRIQGSLVGWHHQTEHQARLTRIQEIKKNFRSSYHKEIANPARADSSGIDLK